MSRVTVTREQFRDAFRAAWRTVYVGEERMHNLEVIYQESEPGWTEVMLGDEPHILAGECFIARVFKELSKIVGHEIQFDAERQDVDAFGRIKVNQAAEYHEGVNVVMIEVENDTKNSYQEFWKLAHSRCELKVLITYLRPGSEALNRSRRVMQEIYGRVCDVLGPDRRDAYLLVCGTRETKKSREILWKFYGLNSDGYFAEVVE